MEGYREFDKSAEERTLEYFDFTAKVFRWVRIILIPVAVIYAFMMLYAYGHGINPLAGIIGLLCILFYVSYLSKGEKAYQQYAREAREAMEQGSQAPYSPKARELRDKQQKAGKGVYYLIAGMMVFFRPALRGRRSCYHDAGRQFHFLGICDFSPVSSLLPDRDLLYPYGPVRSIFEVNTK